MNKSVTCFCKCHDRDFSPTTLGVSAMCFRCIGHHEGGNLV